MFIHLQFKLFLIRKGLWSILNQLIISEYSSIFPHFAMQKLNFKSLFWYCSAKLKELPRYLYLSLACDEINHNLGSVFCDEARLISILFEFSKPFGNSYFHRLILFKIVIKFLFFISQLNNSIIKFFDSPSE